MTIYRVRFTLTPAGASSRQNKGRCVAVNAASPKLAIRRVVGHYEAKGRNPHVYAIEIDGVWRKIDYVEGVADTIPGAPPRWDIATTEPAISAAIASPRPMAVEAPEWAS